MMSLSLALLWLSACTPIPVGPPPRGIPSPTQAEWDAWQPPAVVEPAPPVVTPPAVPALSHAGESGWLRAEGYRLLSEDGRPYTVRSLTDFMLLKRYCDTVNGNPQINLDDHLTERIGHGATMLRVLGMAHWIEHFDPVAVPNYWGCLSAFADHLASRGLRLSYVVFADVDRNGDFPGMMPDKAAQQQHFQGAVQTLASHWNVVAELCNECDKNLTNWRDFPRPSGVRTLWSRGSGLGDAEPPLPGWEWFGWHGRRDYPKVWISAEDMFFVTRGIRADGHASGHPPIVGWADEMIGFAEQDQPGRRSTDCELAATLAYSSKAFGSGGTMHTEDGLFSRPLGPRQSACADVFFKALR